MDELRKALKDALAELEKQDASTAEEAILALFGLFLGASKS